MKPTHFFLWPLWPATYLRARLVSDDDTMQAYAQDVPKENTQVNLGQLMHAAYTFAI